MKFIGVLFFVGLICAASAKLPTANQGRNDPPTSINQHFIDFIHNERVNFPCGWPDSGMAPIEPWRIDEFAVVIDSSSEFTGVNFIMRNADVTGQRNLWIDFFDIRLAGLFINFDISINRMLIVGDHSTTANMINGVITIPISGNGRVNMACNNVRVVGAGQLRTLPNGNLHLEHLQSTVRVGTVDATLTGFGALDGAISRMISSAAPGMVNDNQERINTEVSRVLIPGINRFLNQHTMTSLVNLMADRNQNPPPRRCFL